MKRNEHADRMTVKETIDADVLARLQQKKKELKEREEQRKKEEARRKREERKIREKNKTFEQLLNESNLDWRKFK